MNILDFTYFLTKLKSGQADETCFYFIDDFNQTEHYIGVVSNKDKPYWAGYCDIPDGIEFSTAEELVEAEIYDGKSLKERWEQVHIISIWGLSLEEWLKIQNNIITSKKMLHT